MSEIIKTSSPIEIARLALLLDEPESAIILAYQLLENAKINSEIEAKCLVIIKKATA
jgi:hypothetical protein